MLLRNKNSPDIENTRQFERLFEENHKKMRGMASLFFSEEGAPYSSVQHLAEDAVQETFLTAWEKRDALFASKSPEGWLYITLRYIVKNVARAEWTLFRHFTHLSVESDSLSQEDDHILLELQSCVSEDEYRLLKRLYLERATYSEISSEMGISEAALAMRVRRIKDKIRSRLKD